MSIRKTEKLELSLGGDCMNVMYFEHSESMYFDNAEDESIEVHGVTPGHMATLMRNLICCRDAKVKLENLKEHEVRSLRECMHKLTDMFAEYANASTMRGAD
jgi:uncharacterized protein CbrC (UPF0167 family)